MHACSDIDAQTVTTLKSAMEFDFVSICKTTEVRGQTTRWFLDALWRYSRASKNDVRRSGYRKVKAHSSVFMPKTMIRTYCIDNDKDWDEVKFPLLMFAVREVAQELLGFSPFELVLIGCTVRGPD